MSDKHQTQKVETVTTTKEPSFWNLNYWITKLFLGNSRLTVLCLILLVIIGVFSVVSLKTTGFPNPQVSIAIVQTVYPGASSQVVADEVTIPLENAIKGVSEVKRFNSTSSNSFSNIVVTINEGVNADSARNKIDSAVKSVKLPSTVETPKVTSPDIAGPDLFLVITAPEVEKVYQAYEKVRTKLSANPQVTKVEPTRELKNNIVVVPDQVKLSSNNIEFSQLQGALSGFGESLPAVNGVTLDNQKVGISTSVKGTNLDDLKNLSLVSIGQNKSPKLVKLSEVAEVKFEYRYEDNIPSKYSFYNEKTKSAEVKNAVILQVKAPKDVDKTVFTNNVVDDLKSIDGLNYTTRADLGKNYDSEKVYVVKDYSVSDDNANQVNEIIGGIVGSRIGDSPIGYLGYLLGGIQLVVLVMIAFVSWRAALIAAAAIPLSLFFSTIYLYLIGESLNTLVLFSLVLVLGLVVDPALVILEAIQRKIDAGFRGNQAVLEAVKDVGNGIFLASLTNIIVFAPFATLSGILGQIFRYIPVTIVPAVVGSYVVPLIFLSWLGGIILKPNKKSTLDEEKNLWPIAKWLISFNSKILNSSRWIRFGVILLGLVIPLTLAGVMFSNGSIKQVQFAGSDNTNLAQLEGTFLPSVSREDQIATKEKALQILASNPNVSSVTEESSDFSYFIYFKDKADRSEVSQKITDKLNQEIQKEFGDKASPDKRKFFDVSVNLIQVGPPKDNYQISVSVKSENTDKLKSSSLDVGKTLNRLCLENNQVSLKDNCSDNDKLVTKVDDGFTEKDNINYNVEVNRDSLLLSGLSSDIQGPLTGSINRAIKSQFVTENDNELTKVKIGNETLSVYIRPANTPTSLAELQNQVVGTLLTSKPSDVGNISSIANIQKTTPANQIQRVRGQTVNIVKAKVKSNLESNQGIISQASQLVEKYYTDNDSKKSKDLGLEKNSIVEYVDGNSSENQQTFIELVLVLFVAIIVSYLVLALFFNSLAQPLGILYTIPISLIGVLPALYFFVGGQFGFLEIIGMIILVGIVENVAIFLIDSANQKIGYGWEPKRAISYASGVRLRPVILTSITALASLAPLAITSEFYRSIAVVIMFGILSSGIVSLVTTPILFIFFKWTSERFQSLPIWSKILFYPLMPFYLIYWSFQVTKKVD